jgi:hypothetical protein
MRSVGLKLLKNKLSEYVPPRRWWRNRPDHGPRSHRGKNPYRQEGARKIVCADWSDQNTQWEQQRWAYLFSTELISKQEAEAWAERVWSSERGEEERLEEEPAEAGGAKEHG